MLPGSAILNCSKLGQYPLVRYMKLAAKLILNLLALKQEQTDANFTPPE